MTDLLAITRVSTKRNFRCMLIVASALGGVGFAVPVWAQSAPAPAAAGAPTQLEEVVVTAQRRSEKLQDVPVAVTALSSRDLARAHIDDASRLSNVTPGFTWGQQGSDSFPAIRGARTSLVSAQNDPIIGFYLDGIYQSRTQQQSIPLFDLSRVEVQRGPQGTLYGRNTFGGNISVVTAPPTDVLSGAINGEYGNYNQNRVDGYVNIPVTNNFDMRLSAVHQAHDGYVHSAATPGISMDDDDENAERLAIKWDPTDRLDVVVHAGVWDRMDAGSGSYGYKVAGTLINPNTGHQSFYGVPYNVNPSANNGTDIVHGVDIGVPVSTDPYTNEWNYQPFEHIVEEYVSSTVSYDFGPVVLRSIDGYTRFRAHRSADNDQSSITFQDPAIGYGSGVQEPDTRAGTFSQELQLTSKSTVPLQWIIGGFYLHDHINETYEQDINVPGTVTDGYKETTALETNAFAGYAQASYFVFPDLLRVIGGIRYSVEKKSFGFVDWANGTPGTFDFNGAPYSQTSGAPEFYSLTYRAGLELTPDHNSMYYGTISTGFESGGVNDTGGDTALPSSYAPQKVTAYEVGAKNRILQGKVQTELSLFYNDYRNLQINVYTPQVSYFGSAGKAYSEGAEFAARTLPLPDFHVDLTGSYLEAIYTHYISGNNFYGLSDGEDPASVSLKGYTIPMSPKFKTTLSVYYDWDLGQFGTIAPYFNWLHSSSYFTTDYNTALDRQKKYDTFDMSVRWTSENGKYYGEMYGTNVTDVPVLMSGVVGRDERIQVSYGPPALYGFRVGAKF